MTALVTGAASGIGKATVQTLLDGGWQVVGLDLNEKAGHALKEEIDQTGHAAAFELALGDVSKESDIVRAFELALGEFGALDGLVNNAAIQGAFGQVTEIDVEDWDKTFHVLARGVFLGIKHGAQAMKLGERGGSIVNVASIAGTVGDAGPQAYSTAKASVIHMTRVFATELGPDGIRVNSVSPGPTATPLNPRVMGGLSQELRQVQPLPTACQPEDIATVIEFLLSPGSALVTGQDIAVDGGLLAAGPRLGDVLGTNPRRVEASGLMSGNSGVKTLVRTSARGSDGDGEADGSRGASDTHLSPDSDD